MIHALKDFMIRSPTKQIKNSKQNWKKETCINNFLKLEDNFSYSNTSW